MVPAPELVLLPVVVPLTLPLPGGKEGIDEMESLLKVDLREGVGVMTSSASSSSVCWR